MSTKSRRPLHRTFSERPRSAQKRAGAFLNNNNNDNDMDNMNEETKVRCAECGEWHDEKFCHHLADGCWICDPCALESGGVVVCAKCGGKFLADDEDINETADGDRVCDDCLDRFYLECYRCGEYFLKEHLTRTVNGDDVCDDCLERHYTKCDGCGEYVPDEERNVVGDHYFCEDCYNERQEEDNEPDRIHEYHWGHNGWFDGPYYLPKERRGSTLTYGVEIEMAEGSFDSDMCDGDCMYHFEHDGSLSGGDACELITQPCSLAYHREEFGWADILQKCIDNGYVSHNAKCSCGFHVHIGRKCLTDLDELKLDVWFNRYAEYWKHIARRNSSTWGAMNKDKALAECCKARSGCNNHGLAVNHGNSRTVEIRVARGTLRVETVLGTLEAYDGMIHYLRGVGCMDLYNHIEKVWQGYLKYLSARPKEYENAIRMIDRLRSYKVTKDAVSRLEERKARKDNWGKQKKEGK